MVKVVRLDNSLIDLIKQVQRREMQRGMVQCSFAQASSIFAKRIRGIDKRSRQLFNKGLIL